MSATELARRLGDVLGRVRYRRDTFIVERNGQPIARLVPWGPADDSLAEGLRAWREAGPTPDPTFADDLARVNAADRPQRDPWASSSIPAR